MNHSKLFYDRKSINLDITFRCTLQCPNCMRQYLYAAQNKKVKGADMPMKHFKMLVDKFDEIVFCGTISDPIFHPHFIDMLVYLKEQNKLVQVVTAASHKSYDWYNNAFAANTDAIWTFGLDGLPKDSHKYRINQDGEKLFEVMKLAPNPKWKYIVFKYNENDIDQARQLAKDNNIKFNTVYSGRFDHEQYDNSYKPTNPEFVLSNWRNS